MTHRPTVTVGFYMRERFSTSAEALRSIVANTGMPYRLIIVDGNVPAKYRAEMEAVIASAGPLDVRWIKRDRFLYANESRNLIAAEADTDYVCFIENGATVDKGWLEALVDACETFPAGAATPNMQEWTPGTAGRIPHHERTFMRFEESTVDGKRQWRGVADDALRADRYSRPDVHRVETVEGHCNFFSRATLQAIGPFDESLILGTHVDITCLLKDRGIVAVFVPGAVVTHLPIVRLEPDERAFHAFRFDPAKSAASRDAIIKKWNLRGIADFGRFAYEQRLHRLHPLMWKAAALINAPFRIAQRLGFTAYKK